MKTRIFIAQLLLGIEAFSLVAFGGQGSSQTASPSPYEVIHKMADAYSPCNSYKDEGVVTTVFFSNNGRERTTKRPFTTAFVRPDQFRYEFKARRGEAEWNRYIVWREGDSVRTWWSIRPGIQDRDDLAMAIAGATGVSGGSAHTVPRLLLPDEVRGRSLINMTELELLKDEDVNGVQCFKIHGEYVPGKKKTLWIDKEKYLIRRMFDTSEFPDFRTETTTIYKPQINVDIGPDDLKFDPPTDLKSGETQPATPPKIKYDIPEENLKIDESMKSCAAGLPKIYAAIKKYEKDNSKLPDRLSDMVPNYLSGIDLLCLNDTEHRASFSPDPKLPCSYSWQFSADPIPTGWDPTGRTLYRDWKKEQVRFFGDIVPMVRCSHHGDKWLNLSVGGQVWWGQRDWEYMFRPDYASVHRQMLVRQITQRSTKPEKVTSLVGKTAPDFTLEDLNGKQVSLSDFKGKVVLLDFWATWCPPCLRAVPHIEALHAKYKDNGLVVIGLNDERDHGKVSAYAKENISYIVLLDAQKEFAAYGIRSIPTVFYIGPKGKVCHQQIGYAPGLERELEKKVQEFLEIE